jgi:hypothetical protein
MGSPQNYVKRKRADLFPLPTLQRRDSFGVPDPFVSGTNDSALRKVKRTSQMHSKCRNMQTCAAGDTTARQTRRIPNTEGLLGAFSAAARHHLRRRAAARE